MGPSLEPFGPSDEQIRKYLEDNLMPEDNTDIAKVMITTFKEGYAMGKKDGVCQLAAEMTARSYAQMK